MTTPTKRCSTCRAEKPRADFGNDSRRKDGLTPRCRECNRDYLRNWKAKNRERKRELNRQWNSRNAAYFREWRRAWRAENPEANREADRRWREANPEKVKIRDLKRRAAKRRQPTDQPLNLDALWIRDGDDCPLCGEPIDRELKWPDPMSKSIDHIVPLAKGGTHEQANVQWAHLVCNTRKGASLPAPPAIAS